MTRRITLPFKVKKPILACGADLKGAFAIAKGSEAVLVDGFGDLSDPDNFIKYEKAIKFQLKKLKIKPKIVACDLHPGYFSTRFAENLKPYKVQHHEAHIASAIVDHAIKGKVIGVAFDGTGYGSDGKIWGGEFFVGDLKSLKRAGHFEYIPMPGGDKAIRDPWRMAASYLNMIKARSTYFKKQKLIDMIIAKNINSPVTSSVGRFFDAVGSLILSKNAVSKEAELPMELEAIADHSTKDAYKFDIRKSGGLSLVDVSKVVKGVLADLSAKKNKAVVSAKFHNTIACIINKVTADLSNRYKLCNVVLSGGVFQNRLLTVRTAELLERSGLKVYVHSGVPTNDSGIPIGQIAIANSRARCV
ncbi:MAG: hypothetical protein WC738_01120 [Candidatus Omnitrophota bacterium]|jgi:hydrogenase maturation protein HypF